MSARPPVGQGRRWGRRDFAVDAPTLARRLLGQRLVRILPTGERLSGIIVETEAYLGAEDRAAHSFGLRRTARNESMYGPAGTAYVYFTYGMHHCMNVVCGRRGEPVAALLRAMEPVEGLEIMRRNRTRANGAPLRDVDLCSGPGKLCMALAIDRALDGVDLVSGDDLFIEAGPAPGPAEHQIGRSARVGVGYAGEWALAPLRWAIKKNPHVSRR